MNEHFHLRYINFADNSIHKEMFNTMKKILLLSVVLFLAACKGDTTTTETSITPKATATAQKATTPTESKKTGKPIMANFTGSDWCGWCKRLDKSVFHQPGFDKWADDNVVLLELDFPRRFRLPNAVAQQNRGLQQSFGVRGYPTVWLFDLDKDPAGKFNISALGKTGYTKTFDEFKNVIGGYLSQRG